VMSGQGSRTWRSPSSSSVLRSFRRHMIHEIDGVVAERVEVCVYGLDPAVVALRVKVP
jgi:hypothetical protein